MTNGKHKTGTLKLGRGERVTLVVDGCLGGDRARWRLGEWTCTDTRIIFRQSGCMVLQVPIEKLISLHEEDRPYSFGKRRALTVEYRGVDTREHSIWAIGEGLAGCVRLMRATLFQPVTEADITKVVRKLDSAAERIVWHLWEHVHANIGELAKVLNNDDHPRILRVIRDEINGEARSLLGYPLMIFEHRRIVPLTGEEILFSWWMAGSQYRDIIVDDYCESFDEGSFYRIVAELRDLDEGEISVAIEDSAIVFRNRGNNRVMHDMELPPDAGPSFEIKGVRNGMMEIILPKGVLTVSEGGLC